MASWENQAKVGQYFYAPHRSCCGVWQVEYNDGKGNMSSRFVRDFAYREDAKSFVYQMNGWTKATA